MKTSYIYLVSISILMFCITCCQKTDYKNTKTLSPSGKYYIIASVNQTDKTKVDYADVLISVFNSDGTEKFKFNTNAGDFSKWAVGWDKSKDTIIMNSSDIGILAWEIDSNQATIIESSENIIKRAKELKEEKYN